MKLLIILKNLLTWPDIDDKSIKAEPISDECNVIFSVHPASLEKFTNFLDSNYKYNKYIINKELYYYIVSIMVSRDNDLDSLVFPGVKIKRNIK